jgi:pyruvate,water dikinase
LGGKGRQLAELASLRYHVPPGFVVVATAFREFCAGDSVLTDLVGHPPDSDALADSARIDRFADGLRRACEAAPMPPLLEESLLGAFDALGAERVAVRSSYASEDGAVQSYAGQFESILNVGRDTLLDAVRQCWSSVFAARAITYDGGAYWRDPAGAGFAVVVQEMVNATVSGVCFTKHPTTGDGRVLFIEAVWGMGEAHVSGQVSPDTYVLQKDSLAVTEHIRSLQARMLVPAPDAGLHWVEVPSARQHAEKIGTGALHELARLGCDLELVMGYPCDIEWALGQGKIHTLQCRPITT